MSQVFCDRIRERGAPRTWVLVGADLWRSIPKEILEVSLMSQKWMTTLFVVAAAGLLATLVTGAVPSLMVVVALLFVLGALAALSFKRNDRPTEYLYKGGAPKAWTWWTVLAAGLGVVYVLAATGQLIETPKGTNFGALGIALGFGGFIAFGLALRARAKIVGNWMIIIATVPALAFFWLIVPVLLGLAIIFGAVKEISGAAPEAPAAI